MFENDMKNTDLEELKSDKFMKNCNILIFLYIYYNEPKNES